MNYHEFEHTDGMTAVEIAKRIKREPAEIKQETLFMMGVMATQTNRWMEILLNFDGGLWN